MQLQSLDAQVYRQRSRRLAWLFALVFAFLGMLFSSSLVYFWGSSQGGNFYLNLTGVLLGLGLTSLLVSLNRKHPYMAEIQYAWALKKTLNQISNRMPQIKAAAQANQPRALQCLYFYYQGLKQIYHLEDNPHHQVELLADIQALKEQLESLGLDYSHLDTFDPQWLTDLEAG
ncbi:Protein of unknown function [Allopseudospirillum japonicum]|uniref:DUF3087 domain-containing protein n=1 Tax=Allopseudospirillum japonicum TaxID=64971 RepID=A0A1H6SX08_9GAMM|nr:DUF3087 family protein [Allopseudospirillum japonicum]SEI70354.1 Protein of unknown function [Allopseudospirillum japonicum]